MEELKGFKEEKEQERFRFGGSGPEVLRRSRFSA